MGREKGEKGKGKAPDPPRKKRKTLEEREREAAERAAAAFDAMESRRAGGIRIGEQRQNPPRSGRPLPPTPHSARTKRATPLSQPRERLRRGLVSPAEIIAEQEAQEARIRAAAARAQARAQC